jgi:hypothetical protein
MKLLTLISNLLKRLRMKSNTCHNCRDEIDEFNENEYYGINYKIYCGLACFEKDYDKDQEKRSNNEIKNNTQTNQSNKRKDKVYKKKSKQKKTKR